MKIEIITGPLPPPPKEYLVITLSHEEVEDLLFDLANRFINKETTILFKHQLKLFHIRKV